MSARTILRQIRQALPRARQEIWWRECETFHDADGLCRPAGEREHPGITREALARLEDEGRDVLLIEIVPAPEPGWSDE